MLHILKIFKSLVKKIAGYPQFSFSIPVALAKNWFSRISTNCAKISLYKEALPYSLNHFHLRQPCPKSLVNCFTAL